MCDEHTEKAAVAALAWRGLSRREFAALGATATLAACLGDGPGPDGLAERPVSIQMRDGVADGFLVRPAKGRHPAVLIWPDIAGLRDAMKVMARRLAGSGYCVLVVNQFWRGGPPIAETFAQWEEPANKARIMALYQAMTPTMANEDAKAFITFLDRETAVDRSRGIGVQGYCMGGPLAVRTAAARPDRVRAVASFHGGPLVTNAPDSPHRLLAATRADYLFAIARNDDERARGDKDALAASAKAAGRPAEVVVYPADHGWCVPDSPVYDRQQADLAWERLLGLYQRL